MKPSDKSPEIDYAITTITRIDRRAAIEADTCALCYESVTREGFRDRLSLKEYTISGMCQACQDKIFGEEPEE